MCYNPLLMDFAITGTKYDGVKQFYLTNKFSTCNSLPGIMYKVCTDKFTKTSNFQECTQMKPLHRSELDSLLHYPSSIYAKMNVPQKDVFNGL